MRIQFHKKGKNPIDKIELIMNFVGGDADTEHPETKEYKFPYSDYKNHLNEIEEDINSYRTLHKILDVNSGKFLDEYDEIKDQYGEDMARIFDNVPNDPQNDYQNKCYLDNLILRGYDKEGNIFETYDLLRP